MAPSGHFVMEPSDTSRWPVSLADSRRWSGHLTSQAQPSCSAHLINMAWNGLSQRDHAPSISAKAAKATPPRG